MKSYKYVPKLKSNFSSFKGREKNKKQLGFGLFLLNLVSPWMRKLLKTLRFLFTWVLKGKAEGLSLNYLPRKKIWNFSWFWWHAWTWSCSFCVEKLVLFTVQLEEPCHKSNVGIVCFACSFPGAPSWDSAQCAELHASKEGKSYLRSSKYGV